MRTELGGYPSMPWASSSNERDLGKFGFLHQHLLFFLVSPHQDPLLAVELEAQEGGWVCGSLCLEEMGCFPCQQGPELFPKIQCSMPCRLTRDHTPSFKLSLFFPGVCRESDMLLGV